jgi:hypothetical protein
MSDATDLPKEALAIDDPEAPEADATGGEPDPTVAYRDLSEGARQGLGRWAR